MTEKKKNLQFLKYLIIAIVVIIALIFLAKTGKLDGVIKMLTGQEAGPSVSVVTGDDDTKGGVPQTGQQTAGTDTLPEDGKYDSKEEVALYIHLYGRLPSNYVTKAEARAKGWEGGGLDAYFPGCSIGGDKFGNSEGLLPKKKGRQYYECDIDTAGKSSRGAKRIVFSNDGLVYYTEDPYESFELLYGNP